MKILGIIFFNIIVFCANYFLAKKFKLLDKPEKNTRNPVPTLLGISVFIGFFLSSIIFYPQIIQTNLRKGLFIGNFIIFLITLIDELKFLGKTNIKLSPQIRLFLQILAAILAFIIGNFPLKSFVFNGHEIIISKYILCIFFVIWSILIVNAINRFDGINSQASGISTIGFLTIFLVIKFIVLKNFSNITAEHQQYLIYVENISAIFFILSFLSTIIEFKPIGLLRDTGIMIFGFSLAYLAVAGGVKIGTLVVTLSLAIFDAIWVAIHRIFILKKSPLKGDYTHLHHRLLRLGRNKTEIRIFIRRFSFVMMILMLLQGINRTNKIIIFLLMAISYFSINGYLFWIKKLPCGIDKEKI